MFVVSCGDSSVTVREEFRGNPISALPADGILRASGSPYLATDTLRVLSGRTLTIEPGVELRFEPGIKLVVEGRIDAVGTEAFPITFTSGLTAPRRGDWDGIHIRNGDANSRFAYCRFLYGARYGRYYDYRLDSLGVRQDSTVIDYGCLTLINTNPTIERSWFIASGFHALYAGAGSSPIVRNCVMFDNAGNGIYVHSTADPQAEYNIISDNDDWGIYCAALGDARRGDLNFNYNIVIANFSGEFNLNSPLGLGRVVQINDNLDSCDYRFNLRLAPQYIGASKIKQGARWDFRLGAGSAAIDAGPPDRDLEIDQTRRDFGIYRYEYRPGELRRRIPNLPVVGNRLEVAKSPYYLTYDVIIPETETLTIEPGVEIRVEGRYQIKVRGRLISGGEPGRMVRFYSAASTPRKGDWIGLVFEAGGAEGSELRYTSIEHSRWGLRLTGRDALIDHCYITQVDSVGVLCEREAAPTITDCRLEGASIAAILCQFNASPLIRRNTIYGGAGYGILARESSRPVVVNNVISEVGVSGIRLERMSNAVITNNVIAGSGYFGLFCSYNSSPEIRNNIIYRNGSIRTEGIGLKGELSSQPVVRYNGFAGNPVGDISISNDTTLDASNLRVDPRFRDYAGRDFRLADGSPLIDAGDHGILDPDGSRSDIGAFGGPDAPR